MTFIKIQPHTLTHWKQKNSLRELCPTFQVRTGFPETSPGGPFSLWYFDCYISLKFVRENHICGNNRIIGEGTGCRRTKKQKTTCFPMSCGTSHLLRFTCTLIQRAPFLTLYRYFAHVATLHGGWNISFRETCFVWKLLPLLSLLPSYLQSQVCKVCCGDIAEFNILFSARVSQGSNVSGGIVRSSGGSHTSCSLKCCENSV